VPILDPKLQQFHQQVVVEQVVGVAEEQEGAVVVEYKMLY